jgi:hypothetical protein
MNNLWPLLLLCSGGFGGCGGGCGDNCSCHR